MRRFVPLAVLIPFLVGPGTVRAVPGLSGPTGVITIPSALTLGKYEVDLAYDFWKVDAPGGKFTFTDLRGGVGLSDRPDGGLELGAVKPDADELGLTDAYVYGKYRIPGLLPGGALAVGGLFSTDKRNYSSLFLVGSSAIHENVTLHYGGGVNVYGDPLGWSWFGGRRDSGRSDAAFALFGAQIDWRSFTLNVDYNGSFVSYGVTFFPDTIFSLTLFKLGRGDLERMRGLDHRFGFGATLRF